MIRYFVNLFLFLLPPTRFFLLRSNLLRFAGVKVGKGVQFCGHSWIYGRGRLEIGNYTWIGHCAKIYTHESSDIIIGNNCDIGPELRIVLGSHLIGPSDRRAGVGISTSIMICNGCWIGARVLITDGVTISSGCVIGAGSVVVKSNFSSDCLIAGVPATIRKHY